MTNPVRPSTTSTGRGGCLIAFFGILALFGLFWLVGSTTGLFGNSVSMPEYRAGNARTVTLTAKGNKLVDSFYKDSKREGSNVKAFVTTDQETTILEFYRKQTGYAVRETALDVTEGFPPNSSIYFFEKSAKEGGFILIIGSDSSLVQDQKPGETYIILAEGNL